MEVEIFVKNGNVHLVDLCSFRISLTMSGYSKFSQVEFGIECVLYSLS